MKLYRTITHALLISLCSINIAFGWQLMVENKTPHQINCHVYWHTVGCAPSHFYLDAGKTRIIELGGCSMHFFEVGNDDLSKNIVSEKWDARQGKWRGLGLLLTVSYDETNNKYSIQASYP